MPLGTRSSEKAPVILPGLFLAWLSRQTVYDGLVKGDEA